MSLPAGQSSGRTKGWGKANPPRPGAEPTQRERKPLARVSARRSVLLGDDARSTFAPPVDRKRTLKQGTGRRKRPGGPDAAGEWRQQALERVVAEHGRLVDEVTGENLSAVDAEVHHAVEAGDQWMRGVALDWFPTADGGRAQLIWHPDITLVVHRQTHGAHHSRQAPIRRSVIRPETWVVVDEIDRRAGDQWMRCRLEADYPDLPTTIPRGDQ